MQWWMYGSAHCSRSSVSPWTIPSGSPPTCARFWWRICESTRAERYDLNAEERAAIKAEDQSIPHIGTDVEAVLTIIGRRRDLFDDSVDHLPDDESGKGAHLFDVDLSSRWLRGANLHEATLTNCCFSEAILANCNFRQAILTKCVFGGATLTLNTTFQRATLNCSFDLATLEDCAFGSSILTNCHFGGADLADFDFDEVSWDPSDAPL